jgi:Tfp pilus assembly protein PilF/peroxiredoxin
MKDFTSPSQEHPALGDDPRSRQGRKPSRREFLRWCSGVSALWLPANYGVAPLFIGQEPDPQQQGPLSTPLDYRITPHYPEGVPLDDVMRKVHSELDVFPTETYAEKIEAILARWGEALRQSPADYGPLEGSLSPELTASPLVASDVKEIRSGPPIEVRRLLFPSDQSMRRNSLVAQLRTLLGPSDRLLVAEFKIPSLSVVSSSPLMAQTKVCYNWVLTGSDFHREERLGEWSIKWGQEPSGEWRVLEWQVLGEQRCRTLSAAFVDITSQTFGSNASYGGQLLQGADYWRTVLDGASGIDVYGSVGVACGDIDNDGFDDLYVCQPSGLPNRLYRNRGDGTFEDITEAAGVGVLDATPCALFADVDNDGYQDLLVVRVTGPLLFINQRNGTFRLKPDAFRFAEEPQGAFTGAAFGDYDRDGRLDVYFCLYSYYKGLTQNQYPMPYYHAQNGPPNFLFRNNGDQTFTDVTARAGLDQNNNRYSFDCHWADYDNDGWPDLYVVNDFGRNNLYHNNGNGTFTDVADRVGVSDIGPGMSACWFDYDNDGWLDLYVSNMWEAPGLRLTMQEAFSKQMPRDTLALYRRFAKGNSLYRNLKNGSFEDRSLSAGTEQSGWSWSNHAWDFDHDGYLDLYIANGLISGPRKHELESFFWRQAVAQSFPVDNPSGGYQRGWNAINELIRSDGTWGGYQRNVSYLNNHDGTFTSCAGALGLDFLDDSQAFALADYDHDGRIEVFLTNRTGPQLRLLRCEMQNIGNSIAFRLRGTKSNRDAVGAVILLETEPGNQTRHLQAGTGFCSQHSKEIFFGLGKGGAPVHAQIRWPSGLLQEFRSLPVNHRIEIAEGSAQFRAEPFRVVSGRSSLRPETPRSSPLPTACETWLLDPVAAPDFELPDIMGRKHTLAEFQGRRVLLSFWALESPASLEVLDTLERQHVKWAGEGLHLIAVNVDGPVEADKVRAFVHEKDLSFVTVLGSVDMAGIYNVLYRYMFARRRDLGIPTSFLIDEKGDIVKIYQGTLSPNHVADDLGRIPKSPEERVRMGLPFQGISFGGGFRRDNLAYGIAFYQRGYMDQALKLFQFAVRDNPDDAGAQYNLGTLYLIKGMPAAAREPLVRALQIRPIYPEAEINLGIIAAQGGQPQAAERYFEAAIRQKPNDVGALMSLGTLYRLQGRFAEAQARLEQALRSDPNDPKANYELGMLFSQKGDTERAHQFLQAALRLRPDFPEALNDIGIIYWRTQDLEDAAQAFQKCIRVSPDFDQPYLNLAKVYAAAGKRDLARQVLQQLLARSPDNSLARNALEQLMR